MTTMTTDILSRPVFGRTSALKTLRLWVDAAKTRRALRNLSDHELADIGLNPRDAATEAARPFWDIDRRA